MPRFNKSANPMERISPTGIPIKVMSVFVNDSQNTLSANTFL